MTGKEIWREMQTLYYIVLVLMMPVVLGDCQSFRQHQGWAPRGVVEPHLTGSVLPRNHKTLDWVFWSCGCPKTKAIFLTEKQGWILASNWVVFFLTGTKAVLPMSQDLWAVDMKQLSIFTYNPTSGQEANLSGFQRRIPLVTQYWLLGQSTVPV